MTTDYEFKIILLGDSGVGKTSLVRRFITDKFKHGYKPTLGAEILIKEIYINSKSIILQIWDLTGAINFKNIRQTFYQKANAAFLVSDLSRPTTLSNIDNWIEEVNHAIGEKCDYIIIGNKLDLELERNISPETLMAFGNRRQIPHIETSAKTGDNVNDAFYQISRILIQNDAP